MSNPIKSAEMAPVLQSMQDYICNHFTDELMDEVSSAVSLGLVEDLDIDAEGGKPVVQRNESKIIRTEFWRLDCTKLLADIKMRVKIGVSRDHGIPHYVVRYVNFSAQFTLDGGITLHQGIRELTTCCLPERKLPKLSKYLVPVLSYDEMEIMVLQLLRKYRGEQAVLTFQENGATALAQAMGLEIRRVSLYRNHHTAAILYLREGHVRVVASGASGSATDDEPFQDMTIPAKPLSSTKTGSVRATLSARFITNAVTTSGIPCSLNSRLCTPQIFACWNTPKRTKHPSQRRRTSNGWSDRRASWESQPCFPGPLSHLWSTGIGAKWPICRIISATRFLP